MTSNVTPARFERDGKGSSLLVTFERIATVRHFLAAPSPDASLDYDLLRRLEPPEFNPNPLSLSKRPGRLDIVAVPFLHCCGRIIPLEVYDSPLIGRRGVRAHPWSSIGVVALALSAQGTGQEDCNCQ